MRQRWFSGAGILLSLILMALPCSVSMTAEWSDAGQTGACSYLSLHPILYGNWFPLLAVGFPLLAVGFPLLAVGFALLALVFLLLRRDFRQMTPVCLALAMISQVLSWILFASFSVTGAAAVLLQAAVLAQDVKAALALRT